MGICGEISGENSAERQRNSQGISSQNLLEKSLKPWADFIGEFQLQVRSRPPKIPHPGALISAKNPPSLSAQDRQKPPIAKRSIPLLKKNRQKVQTPQSRQITQSYVYYPKRLDPLKRPESPDRPESLKRLESPDRQESPDRLECRLEHRLPRLTLEARAVLSHLIFTNL